jgi:hypothetical protein
VRLAAFVALRNAAPHKNEATPAVANGLSDTDARVRIQAAEAALALRLGSSLETELLARLNDPVWTVRWLVAALLTGTAHRARALEALSASMPKRGSAGASRWSWILSPLREDPDVKRLLDSSKQSTSL